MSTAQTRVFIATTYSTTSESAVDLPAGKTWADVESYFVKWGEAFLFFRDGTSCTRALDYPEADSIDWKRPDECQVYAADESGESSDWNQPLVIAEESAS